MNYIAKATVKTKVAVTAAVKKKITLEVGFPVLTSACPQYDLLDGGTPSWNYQPIGSFDLISGGTP
jgi:hypothetical protein